MATQKLRITAVLELNAAMYPPDDEDAQHWLIQDILLGNCVGDRLILHSNEVGDELGTLEVEQVEQIAG